MPLTYSAGVYQLDGVDATDQEIVAFRDAQILVWQDELAQIAEDELGDGATVVAIEFPLSRIEAFATRFLAKAQDILVSAYIFARGGLDRLAGGDWTSIADLVGHQDEYGRGYLDDLRQGDLSPAQAVARARLYGGAGIEAFERGKAAQRRFDAPAYPTEGCEGLSNCRCYWTIEEFADRIEGTWNAAGDRNTCAVCRERATTWAPYVQRR